MKNTKSRMIKIVMAVMASVVFCLSTPSITFAQNLPSDSTEIQRQRIRLIHERLGDIRVYVDGNGRIIGIKDFALGSFSPGELVDRLYGFLERNADIFDIINPRQELPLSFNHKGTVEFHQVVDSVRVLLSFIHIEMMAEGNMYYMTLDNHYYPDARNVNTTPTIDSLAAGRIAQADPVHGNAHTTTCCYELFISSTHDGVHPFASGGTHLVWQFGVDGGAYQGHATYMIDAHSGQILDARCDLR